MKASKAALAIGFFVLAGLGALEAQAAEDGRFGRFHLRVGTSIQPGDFSPRLYRDLESWGFGDDLTKWVFLFGYVTFEFPQASSKARLDLQLDYSVTRDFTVGLSVSSLGSATGQGRDSLGTYYEDSSLTMDVLLDASVRGRAYFLNAAYAPPPKPGRRLSTRAGVGVGLGDVQIAFETDLERKVFDRHPLCGQAFAGFGFWPIPRVSIGAALQYRYVPAFAAFEIGAQYYSYDIEGWQDKTYSIPASNLGLGGLGLSLSLGLHL